MKDWTGNSRSAHAILGARNYAQNERETHDYYATEPKAAALLLGVETFAPVIWECACGEGHLVREFEKAGYMVYASDLIDRGCGEKLDFLATVAPPPFRAWTSLRTHRIPLRKSLWNTRSTSQTMAARSRCFSKYSFWRASPGGGCLKDTHPKPFMSVPGGCGAR